MTRFLPNLPAFTSLSGFAETTARKDTAKNRAKNPLELYGMLDTR